MSKMTIQHIPLEKIKPSKTNPRHHFDDAYIAELSDSIRAKGILQPLSVRPDWCVGKTDEDIAKMNGDAERDDAKFFEIVAGECRYRGAAKAKLIEAPVIVRHFSDKETLEVQIIENLQRSDLTPLEEAEGYRRLMDEYDYTVEMIHEKTGKDRKTIYGKLKILNAPKVLLDALVKGDVGEGHCELVGRIPVVEMRERAAREILKPNFLQEDKHGGLTARPEQAMSFRIARDHVHDNYMRSLSSAEFDQGDAGLVSPIVDDDTGERIGGGACTDCPMRSGCRPDVMGDLKRPDICTNPKCFALKTDAYFVRLQKTAEAEGKKLLSDEESAELFDPDGSLSWDCPYVKLSEQPARNDCRDGVKITSWKKLLEGLESKPQIVIARDPKGRVLELVDRQLAVEAVNLAAKQKGETSIFEKRDGASRTGSSAAGRADSGGGSPGEEEPEWKKQERKNRDIAKVNFEVTLAAMTELIGKIDKRGAVKGFWDALIKASIDHAGHDGAWLVCKRNGLDPKKGKRVDGIAGEGVEGAALEYGLTLTDDKLKLGYVVELLLSQRVKIYNSGSMGGIRGIAAFKEFAKLYDVDIAAVERHVKADAKEKKSIQGRAKPDGKIRWERKPKASYKFNSNGVCEDPSVLRLPFAKSTKITVDISVALNGKKWVTGYDANWGAPTATGSGGASAAPAKGRESYKTLREALVGEAQSLHKHLKNSFSKPALKLMEMHIGALKTMELDDVLSPPIEHKFEHIAENKFRCECGAFAVRTAVAEHPEAIKTSKFGLLLLAKEFRGKPCSRSDSGRAAKKKPKKKTIGGLSAAGRKRLGAMMKARWAARRRDQAKKAKTRNQISRECWREFEVIDPQGLVRNNKHLKNGKRFKVKRKYANVNVERWLKEGRLKEVAR